VCGPVGHADLVVEPVFAEELAVLAAADAGGLDAVLHQPDLKIIVLRAGCSYRQRLEQALVQRGIVAFRTLEFGTVEAILACVAAGIGVTLLPRALLAAVARDRRIAAHRLPPAEAHAETVFIRRRDAFVSSALATLLAMARPLPQQTHAAQ
jgi:DNA-binding transcriptional LysR family regulator